MLPEISKHRVSDDNDYQFSIVIPTWNNLDYLQLCLKSIRQNSAFRHQIIVVVNEGSDGTLEWIQEAADMDYIHATENIGICYGLNIARPLVRADYLLYLNDDMYLLPGWDVVLMNEIRDIGHTRFMLSGTMVEPVRSGNPCVVVKDFGQDLESFREEELLVNYRTLYRDDWSGSMWPPSLVPVDLWDLVGGLSIEFSPGMYSDPDFARKLWETGVRTFKGCGRALAYHFSSKSTGRIRKNNGRKLFLQKWGITSKTFTDKYLQLGAPYRGALPEPHLGASLMLLNRIKRVIS
ncbi:MAG: hypothetical protein Kow00127_18830 [Bacteroidales bacterium]